MPPSRRCSGCSWWSTRCRWSSTPSAISSGHALVVTAIILRLTAAAGALVLVHNLYGQAAPSSRSGIRLAMIALALMWAYDLNLYTIAYFDPGSAKGLFDWRGLRDGARRATVRDRREPRTTGWRIRLSRAATFQSLSLLAICAYFAVMAVLVTALRGSGFDWTRALLVALLAAMTVAAMVLLPSSRARGWAKVKIAKHFFEHRYDYRTEWLRFTETIGATGSGRAAARPAGDQGVRRHPRCARRAAARRRREWLDRAGRELELVGQRQSRARRSPARRRSPSGCRSGPKAGSSISTPIGGGWADARDRELDIPSPAAWGGAGVDRRPADPRRPAGRPRPARSARLSPPARLGGFRPAPHRRAPGGLARSPKPTASRR